jgi:hypothetical protein
MSGIVCSTYRYAPAPHFETPQWVTLQFGDTYGWNDARYFPSVRFGNLHLDGFVDVCGRGTAGVYCGINQSGPGFLGSMVRAGDLVQPEMSDANNWGSPASNLDSLLIADIDGDGKGDVCGLNTSHQGGNPEFFCAISAATSAAAQFGPLLRRIKSISVVGKVASGRLYPTRPDIGFCWAQADGSVGCSVQFR